MKHGDGRRFWHPGRGALRLCVVLLSGVAALATQVRLMTLEEMAARAGRIFSGRCLEVRVELDPVLGQPVTVAVFDVERAIKGPESSTVSLRILASSVDLAGPETASADGGTLFRKGEEVVLFLYAESPLGLTSPVGLGQGKFTVSRDRSGRELAVNEFGNRNLLAEVSDRESGHTGEAATTGEIGKKALLQATASALARTSSDLRSPAPPAERDSRR